MKTLLQFSQPHSCDTQDCIIYAPKLAYKVFTGSCICLAGCFCCHKSSADFGGGGLAGLFSTSIVLPQASRDWLRGGGGGLAGRTVEKKWGTLNQAAIGKLAKLNISVSLALNILKCINVILLSALHKMIKTTLVWRPYPTVSDTESANKLSVRLPRSLVQKPVYKMSSN